MLGRPGYDARVSATADHGTRPFASIEEAIEEIRNGRFVVVVDDEDRENEGDLNPGFLMLCLRI